MTGVLAAVLLTVGSGFMLLAAIGVVRMPDLFLRLQATSKATTLGVSCLLLGVAVHFGDLGNALRAMAIIALFFVTAPIAAHVIARAAYFVGTELWQGSVVDEIRGHYDKQTHELRSDAEDRGGV